MKEIQLKEPIRYKENDEVEKWLVDLLCLDCTGQKHHITQGTPALESCQLFYINKDTLFSRNAVTLLMYFRFFLGTTIFLNKVL